MFPRGSKFSFPLKIQINDNHHQFFVKIGGFSATITLYESH